MLLKNAGAGRRAAGIAIALCTAVALSGTVGCASRGPKVLTEADAAAQVEAQQNKQQRRGLFGLFGRKNDEPVTLRQEAGLGVNGFLWRASLDVLSFMPLVSADPYGGLIVTDWYTSPEKPDERFKATVYILDTRLRADGLNVALFKQVRGADGTWRDAAPAAQTETDIENSILTRARQIRVNGRS